MNDKQQLAAMGEHMAEQPMCMAKRIEELEAQIRHLELKSSGLLGAVQSWKLEYEELAERHKAALDRIEDQSNKLVWRNTGSPNGLRRFMTQKQYAAQTPGVQKWYEPIRYEAPKGWQLVPVVPGESMCEAGASVLCQNRQSETDWIADVYCTMLSVAPNPDATK